MRMVAESHVHILHIACSASEYDACHELIGQFFGHLMPRILHYFLHTSFDEFYELAALHLPLIVDVI